MAITTIAICGWVPGDMGTLGHGSARRLCVCVFITQMSNYLTKDLLAGLVEWRQPGLAGRPRKAGGTEAGARRVF